MCVQDVRACVHVCSHVCTGCVCVCARLSLSVAVLEQRAYELYMLCGCEYGGFPLKYRSCRRSKTEVACNAAVKLNNNM